MIKSIKDYFSQEKKELKEMSKIIEEINGFEMSISNLSDEQIYARKEDFQNRLNSGETIEEILPEAFAVVKEGIHRIFGIKLFDVQLLGGLVLFNGNIAEMKTGEGKTLVAPLTAYVHSLSGGKTHIFTANDYLAKRDCEWLNPLYLSLGLTVDSILTNKSVTERQIAYKSDVVYGTGSEFGYDFLRNNLVRRSDMILNDRFSFAIVDEADTILIDEARVPLVLSELAEEVNEDYYEYPALIEQLEEELHFELVNEDLKANLTEEGIEKVESIMSINNLYSSEHILKLQRIQNALIAKYFIENEKNYVIQDNKIRMIDFFSGRIIENRRFADGMQQSLEAKEGVGISPEHMIKGSITFQNFLRKYDKIAGMTGTAKTEEDEFVETYGMYVYEIPTNKPVARDDYHDLIFKTKEMKNNALIEEILAVHEHHRPILIGTESVEESEYLSGVLKEKGLEPTILNAKNHEKEAAIIKNAGEKDSITIITNMAGRGTDIKLGEGVNDIGGLHVIITTRHENRRVDNQVRGRAGRQGDKGSSVIYVSLEDELVKRFGGDKVRLVFNKVKLVEDKPIEHSLATKLIEQMQMQSEAAASSTRTFIKRYDDVLSNQRDILYESRQNLLLADEPVVKEQLFAMYRDVFESHTLTYCEGTDQSEWDYNSLVGSLNRFFFPEDETTIDELKKFGTQAEIIQFFYEKSMFVYNRKEKGIGEKELADASRKLLLAITDKCWFEHIATMEHLRRGLGVKGQMGNPFLDFSIESHDVFDEMIFSIKEMATMNTLMLEFTFINQ